MPIYYMVCGDMVCGDRSMTEWRPPHRRHLP